MSHDLVIPPRALSQGRAEAWQRREERGGKGRGGRRGGERREEEREAATDAGGADGGTAGCNPAATGADGDPAATGVATTGADGQTSSRDRTPRRDAAEYSDYRRAPMRRQPDTSATGGADLATIMRRRIGSLRLGAPLPGVGRTQMAAIGADNQTPQPTQMAARE